MVQRSTIPDESKKFAHANLGLETAPIMGFIVRLGIQYFSSNCVTDALRSSVSSYDLLAVALDSCSSLQGARVERRITSFGLRKSNRCPDVS
ncbi:unnamed protein product [Soboliphyme baturini]|uniref:Pentatricopeptide repeat-containing protein n=1 Tax=Soboliphyme baturini TaxID=241478 RepID=A0A183IDK8_9BILA|nr:unnamed protein product [Soboliphyme baturini]